MTDAQVGPLKPYTKYRCTSCGHAGMWTGAYLPVHQQANDDICKMCGATLVEEVDDGRRWRVSFESVSAIAHPELYAGDRARPGIAAADLDDSYWHPSHRETSSEHDARQQLEGLHRLIAEGEFIRNVKLEVAVTRWEPADPRCPECGGEGRRGCGAAWHDDRPDTHPSPAGGAS